MYVDTDHNLRSLPDGPANLLEAVTVAASSSAKNRGAMIVLNDRI